MIKIDHLARMLTLIAILLGAPLPAHAQCDPRTVVSDSDRLAGLDLFYQKGCMGGGTDPNTLTRAVSDALANVTPGARTEQELAQRRNALLDLLSQVEGSLTGSMAGMSSPWQGYAGITLSQLQTARAEIAGFESTVRAEYWARGQDYGFFEQPTTGTFLISYEQDIDAACPSANTTDDCSQAVANAIALTRHINLVHSILANQVRERLALLHAELVKLDGEWDYYFQKARSQFWWEFMANNAIYDPSGDQFARPPSGQLILLHPSAAMEYVESDDQVDRSFNVVGTFELIGYNRLRWREDGPYSKWPLGASLVATWSPSASGDDFGYGVMVHVRNSFSLGATRRDTGDGSETTWLFSVDLTRLFLQKSEAAKRTFRGLDP